MNYEVISALSKIYFSIYRIDLNTGRFEEISSDSATHRITGLSGNVSLRMSEAGKQVVSAEYLPLAEGFFDFSTLKQRLRDQDTISLEYQVADGNWHLARFIVQSRDEAGEPVQVLFTMRMFSEEKRREKTLVQAMEEANQANEAKSEFLSRMSHDIRTPLNVMMGFTGIALRNRNDAAKMAECLEKIRVSGGNLQRLIDDVLDISRIESGELRLLPQPVALDELFGFYRQAAEGLAQEKELTLEGGLCRISHNLVMADPIRLGQVYMNLLSNAVKYTPAGGKIRFQVSQEPSQAPGRVRLVTVVGDTGIGIDPAYQAEMYAAFSRAVDTRVNKVRGSGLGLTLVKKIVDLMEGDIRVKSRPGQGTTFTVTFDLPVADAPAAPDSAARLPEQSPALRELTLLVAEDNDLNYEIVAEQLADYGIRCVRAKNGRDCVRLFQSGPPERWDAILMDMQMPVMDGPEAAAAIRALQDPRAQSIPILALTANVYPEDIDRCLAAGMNAHLPKPLQVEQAIRAVLACVEQERAGRAGKTEP